MPQDLTSLVLKKDDPTMVRMSTQTTQLSDRALAIEVMDDTTLAEATGIAQGLIAVRKFWNGIFKPIQDQNKKAVATTAKQWKEQTDPVDAAEELLRRKMADYGVTRAALVKQSQAAMESDARSKAVDQVLGQAVRLTELAKTTGDARYEKAAEQLLAQPIRTPLVSAEPPKIAGMNFRPETSVTVDDVVALARAVADGKVNAKAILGNLSWLKKQAEQDGEGYDIPGTTRHVTTDVTIRG